MKRKLIFLTVTLLIAFSFAQMTAATEVSWHDGPRLIDDKCVNPVYTLDLTAEQATKILQVKEETYKQIRELKIKHMDSMHQLDQLQLQKNPDQAKIDAQIKEINDLRTQMFNLKKKTHEQINALLTPAQKEELNKKRGERKGWQ